MRSKLRTDVVDLTGETFGRLRVVGVERHNGRIKQKCICTCGSVCYVRKSELGASTMSCGCWKKDGMHAMRGEDNPSYKHGYAANNSKKLIYSSWSNMLNRCSNPKNCNYHRYGGRGISVYEPWRDFESFLKDVGEPPSAEGYWSIGRIDNDKNYEPGNVRWEGRIEQARNRRSCVWLEHEGKRMLVTDWELHKGYRQDSIAKRLRRGWSVADAIDTPPRVCKNTEQPTQEPA